MFQPIVVCGSKHHFSDFLVALHLTFCSSVSWWGNFENCGVVQRLQEDLGLSTASSIEGLALDGKASGLFICPQKFLIGVGNRCVYICPKMSSDLDACWDTCRLESMQESGGVSGFIICLSCRKLKVPGVLHCSCLLLQFLLRHDFH